MNALYVDVFKRSDCVTCDSTPSCPTCDDDEECIMTTQTCDECPKTYCSAVSSSVSSDSDSGEAAKKKVGAISGGVIGFVFIASAIGFFIFYKYYYKPRKLYNKEKNDEEFKFQIDENNMVSEGGISGSGGSGTDAATRAGSRLSQVTLSTMAASVLTKASNVIPIAYIPGVTVKYQQKKGGGAPSIYSDIDNASIIGGDNNTNTMMTQGSAGTLQSHNANTTTAIRARPKLVNIDSSDDQLKAAAAQDNNIPRTAVSIVNLGGVKIKKIKASNKNGAYQPGLQNDLIEEVEEEEEEEEGEDAGSLFDLNIQLDDNINPFNNSNTIILEEPELESDLEAEAEAGEDQHQDHVEANDVQSHASDNEDDDDDDTDSENEYSIEGLSDDDDYDPNRRYD